MNKPFALAVLICAMTPVLSSASDLEGRVTRIENILNNQRSSDLLLQIQRLQQEIQQLRGQVEQQRYELNTLKRQQKDQYLDLDARLSGQGGRPSAAQGPGPALAPSLGTAPGPANAMLTPSSPSGAVAAGRGQAAPGGVPQHTLPGPGQPVGEREAYRNAFDLLKQRRYDEAVAAFEGLLARYPNGEFADNALYWLGETYYVKREYETSLAEFQRLLDKYPLSPKVAGSMLKIGYIQDERKDWRRARSTLENLVRKFPDSTEARLAKGRLDRMTRDGH